MRTIIREKEIKEEILKIHKPLLYDDRNIPYRNLTDRDFEILIYYLFQSEKIKREKLYTNINLMSGVAERGRDCILYRDSKVTGVIQCKHSKKEKKMDRTSCIKEIVKFILNVIKYGGLGFDKNNIEYYLVHSEGFYEPGQNLLNNFNKEIFEDKEELKKLTLEVIKEYKKIDLTFDNIKGELIAILKSIKVTKLEKVDIDKMILNNNDILDMFFQIQKVIVKKPELPRLYEDETVHEEIIEKYSSNRFIKEIEKIKLKGNDKINAIGDFWKTTETIDLLVNQDYFNPEVIKKYAKDLKERYEYEYENSCEDIEEDHAEAKICRKSRLFYRNIMKESPINLINIENNRPFFQRGFYHDLVNCKSIETWKLKPYEDGEEYE